MTSVRMITLRWPSPTGVPSWLVSCLNTSAVPGSTGATAAFHSSGHLYTPSDSSTMNLPMPVPSGGTNMAVPPPTGHRFRYTSMEYSDLRFMSTMDAPSVCGEK